MSTPTGGEIWVNQSRKGGLGRSPTMFMTPPSPQPLETLNSAFYLGRGLKIPQVSPRSISQRYFSNFIKVVSRTQARSSPGFRTETVSAEQLCSPSWMVNPRKAAIPGPRPKAPTSPAACSHWRVFVFMAKLNDFPSYGSVGLTTSTCSARQLGSVSR